MAKKLSPEKKNTEGFKPSVNSLLDIGARGRGRTGTRGKPRGILSPVRLPIPPPGHDKYNCIEHRAKVKLDLAIR